MTTHYHVPWFVLATAADRVPIIARMHLAERDRFTPTRRDAPECTVLASHVLDATGGDVEAAENLLREAAREQRAAEIGP